MDVGYILSSWLRSDSHTYRARECGRIYSFEYHKILAQFLQRKPHPTVRVCCLPDDEDAILGWSITEPDCVHYVYVRKELRRQGIASKLLDGFLSRDELVFSHKPALDVIGGDIESIRAMISPNWIYNPYRIFA